jgi:hypothetical protein
VDPEEVMSLIERYIFRMASLAFLGALGGLTGVIWVTQALKDFDLLTTKGQSLLIFFFATGLVIPSLVMIIAPIALFAAILFTLNKLNGDSELVVMSAAGLSPGGLLRPFAMLMVVVALMVGSMSLPMTGTWLTVPAGMRPGHRASPGSRMPPSWRSRLRPRSPPVEPRPGDLTPSPSGPLSEVK